MDGELVGVIGALCGLASTVITGWFAYNQKTKDKMTDMKIERLKAQEKQNGYKRSANTGKVLGELYKVMIATGADRVYIVQPHPLGHIAFLSIQFEVKANGVEGMKMSVQKLEMSEVPLFSKMMTENIFMYFDDIDNQVEDRVAKSLMSSNGTIAVAVKRLNSSRDWVGSIFCEFLDEPSHSKDEIHKILHEAALNIQFNLPEFQDNEFDIF